VQGEPVATIAEIRDTQGALIEPLRRVLSRPMVAGEVAPTDAALAAREITVLADKSLAFEVVKKVMATCTAAAYGKISLAVLEKDKPGATTAS
jgi:biopolymer transport protein TolR